jgi:hypothetical protein
VRDPDLFAGATIYNEHAGFQHTDTSIAAAKKVTPGIRDAHDRILAALEIEPLTPDELGEKLKMDKLYARPRCSELKAMGLIVDTGQRRRNSSRCTAEVLKLK